MKIFLVVLAIVSLAQLALSLDINLLNSTCYGYKQRLLEFDFYLHTIRTAINSSLEVNETPVTGLARQFPPYSFGYTFAFSRKLTSSFEYTSPEIGRMEGYTAVPSAGQEFTQADFNFTTPASGYFTVAGYTDFTRLTNKYIVNGGIGDFAYSIGQVIVTTAFNYTGNNFVFLCKASLTVLKLC
ncbi:uncharacterized protein LOC112341771 [Selaginella moellendorffii]|uniref:uncharacterized protein LOC112341771 n=1 Tax=Selaginella moellendorffii TaxID=88036 RepID=UPI000D1C609F|nr:uncharacterized protein LOC112341771 [Selaginella moellendorffii]|eukprot:XP_024518208.1 uncharacterized protein LOC112341771 [Selaginella moellendorffii]